MYLYRMEWAEGISIDSHVRSSPPLPSSDSDTGGKPPESCVFSLICFCLAATGEWWDVHYLLMFWEV